MTESIDKNKKDVIDQTQEGQGGSEVEGDSFRFSQLDSGGLVTAGVSSATWKAVVGGETTLNKLVDLASHEYHVNSFEARGIITDMMDCIRNVAPVESRSFGQFGGVGLSGSAYADNCGDLGSPMEELELFTGQKRRRVVSDSLDDQINEAVQGKVSQESLIVSSKKRKKKKGSIGLVEDNEDEELIQSSDGDEDADLDNLASKEAGLLNRSLESHSNKKKGDKPMVVLSRVEELARQVVAREVEGRACSKGGLQDWDPLASVLDNDTRKSLLKDVDSDVKFIQLPGSFPPPLKGKGSAVFNRDNSLFKLMGDMAVVMKGLARSVLLNLEGKAPEAVVLSSKVLVLAAHSISRMNAERLRVHFPREFANRVLRPSTEPILRDLYRRRAHESAQDLRDSNVLVRNTNSGNFLRRGGRGIRGRFQYNQKNKFNSTPFPQFNRFRNYRQQQSQQVFQKKDVVASQRK